VAILGEKHTAEAIRKDPLAALRLTIAAVQVVWNTIRAGEHSCTGKDGEGQDEGKGRTSDHFEKMTVRDL
jgi:hypothetical protein